ncbi:MAG: hypothetical protein HOY71_19380 [Nonomuraea sp.]|nr:hypothetical protein [Nonomuraea sp.]
MKGLISLLAAAAMLAAPGDPGGPRGDGFQDGRTAGVKLSNSKIVITGNGAKGGTADGYQIQRPCWYEPGPDASGMLKTQQDVRDYWFRMNPNGTEEQFQKFLKQFKDKIGQPGRWWTPAYNDADPKGRACWGGLNPFVWVPPGTTPPAGITFEQLAQIARAALTVPEPSVQLSPDVRSFVNLPTWVWVTGIGEPRRSVTATLPGVMSATVVAELKGITIDPGTTAERAEVRQDCGASGKPYVKGGQFTCGVRYLHASVDVPKQVYTLTVTANWPVRVAERIVPFQYAPVEVKATRDVPVGEVQSGVKP